MKLLSYVLSLILSDIRPEDIYVQLLFISLVIKSAMLTCAVVLNLAIKRISTPQVRTHRQSTGHLSLCH